MLVNELLGIYQIKLPLPFKLNHVNCYVIKGKLGWWIIDTGLHTEHTQRGWQNFMQENEIRGEDIRGIYLTHYHPDHFGTAGMLQQISGAPVYISKKDAGAVKRIWEDGGESMQAMPEVLAQLGMDSRLNTSVVSEMTSLIPFTMPHPKLSLIEPGQVVMLGDFAYQVLLTPGHSDGHICFYNREHEVLFSGDHILPKITSNIGLWPKAEPNPLKNYLQSLEENCTLACRIVYPAHGQPFTNLQERINQLKVHHNERIEAIKHYAQGVTAFEVCQKLFSQDLSLHEMRFAVTETYAHLMYLVYNGELRAEDRDGVYYFTQTDGIPARN